MNDEYYKLFVVVHKLAVCHDLIEGVWNHVSFEIPNTKNHILFTPGHTHWDLVNENNITTLDNEGSIIAGDNKILPVAWKIHKPIHSINPDYRCLIHIHTPYITSTSIYGEFETRLTQHSSIFHNDVSYFNEYIENIDDTEMYELMAECIKGKRVLFLKNHGAIISGFTLGEAYMATYLLEKACMYQCLTLNHNSTCQLIPESIVIKMKDNFFNNLCEKHFNGFLEYYKNKLT